MPLLLYSCALPCAGSPTCPCSSPLPFATYTQSPSFPLPLPPLFCCFSSFSPVSHKHKHANVHTTYVSMCCMSAHTHLVMRCHAGLALAGAQQVALLLPDGQVLQQLTKPGSPASHQPQQQPSPRRISSTAGSRRGSFGVHGYGRCEQRVGVRDCCGVCGGGHHGR